MGMTRKLARAIGAWTVLFTVGASGPAVRAAPAAEPAVTIDIQAEKPGPKIERDLFGQFAEHLGHGIYGGIWVGKDSPIPNVRGIRSDVVAALKAIKVPNVRWPGGCYADEYHWRDGIGPADQRPTRLNANWGGVIEPNSFGTAEYMDFLQQIGAEAYISVNIGSGSAEEASSWFEYMTSDKPSTLAKERAANGHPAPYKIKFVGLGNENWGCGGAMSADHYVEEMKRFSHYTRNLNPTQQQGVDAMKRIAVGWDAADSDYTEAVMKAWKSKVWSWDIDGVSLHSYTVGGWPPHMPSSNFGEDDYAKLIHETLGMETLISKQSAIMDRYDPDKKVALVVDEWGVWLAPNPGTNPGFLEQQNSLRDAIVAALNLDIFMRHADRVRMANIAQMINVLQAMILTDGPKMVLTPTYYVYRMYLPFQNATFVPVTYNGSTYQHGGLSLPALDAVAARDSSGKLWLSLVNVDPERPEKVVLRANGQPVRQAVGEVLTAPRVDAVNTFVAPETVTPKPVRASAAGGMVTVTLPPKSITVVSLQP